VKTYLCIGGPFHGQLKSINRDVGSYLIVAHAPDYGSQWVGPERLSPGADLYPPRESRYNVKRVSISESRRESAPSEQITITVDVRADVELLVHESVLTTEEAAAYFRKLKPNAIKDGVVVALTGMKSVRI
jgi:hypothetical protein